METTRTQEQRSAESRRRLIAAAIELLATKGYNGTSLGAIGAKAGLSRGLVTHHFGTKEQCIGEVVATIRETVTTDLQASPDARGLAAIDLLIMTYLRGGTRGAPQIRAIYVVLVEAITVAPGLLPAIAEHNRVIRSMIATWTRQAVEDGEIEPRADVASDAVVIEGIMRGVIMQYLADPATIDFDAAVAASQWAARALLSAPV